ncbi:MAG: hypothetical protein O2844_04435, partial [Proteobacteria bacterium]|nr:hypothetical protein [Pseudomonadota bacterium]
IPFALIHKKPFKLPVGSRAHEAWVKLQPPRKCPRWHGVDIKIKVRMVGLLKRSFPPHWHHSRSAQA